MYFCSMAQLTDKQETFCREYLIDLNATQATVRAGYSSDTARQQGARLLSNVNIQSRIAELKQARNERNDIDADWVLRQAVELCNRCMQKVRPKTIRGNQVYDENNNAVYEFDSTGAKGALELIGKHVNVQAFIEKTRNEIAVDRVAESPLNNLDSGTLKEIRDVIRRRK